MGDYLQYAADFFPDVRQPLADSAEQIAEELGTLTDAYDDDAPRSTSSAMPDLSSPDVPRLRARVHQRLSVEQYASIPLHALSFRPLQACDFDEMVALHKEWFPVNYDDNFYNKCVSGELVSLVATYPSNGDSEEDILGMITLSLSCEHHRDHIVDVLGTDCATACHSPYCNVWTQSRYASAPEQCSCGGSVGSLVYVLTLGVADGFRRKGLARELLRRSIAYVQGYLPQVQAIYLHVITYNQAAIRLYESVDFVRLKHYTEFYSLQGQPYDSFLYALYLNTDQQAAWWRHRLRKLLSPADSPYASHECWEMGNARYSSGEPPYAPCRSMF